MEAVDRGPLVADPPAGPERGWDRSGHDHPDPVVAHVADVEDSVTDRDPPRCVQLGIGGRTAVARETCARRYQPPWR